MTGNSPRAAEVIFENEILPVRTWSTIIRGVVLQIATLLVFSLTRSLLLLQPFSAEGFPLGWIKTGVYGIIHPSSWFYDGLIVACFTLLGMLYTRNFQTSSKVAHGSGGGLKSVFASALAASNGIVNALTSVLAHVILSACLLRCYIGILGPTRFSSLTMLCNLDSGVDRCMNEAHVFLIMSGAYTGLRVWWKLYGPSNGNVLRFPLVQQSGNSLLRQRIVPDLIKEAMEVGLNLHWFCILYYFLGQKVELCVSDLLHVEHRIYYEESMPMSFTDTFWYYITLLFHTWTMNALLIFNMGILHTIFSINMTKRIRFPITSRHMTSLNDASNIFLMEAMKSDGTKSKFKESSSLLKHLAFQDFADLAAAQSKMRRAEFFTLSQPGGHPHHWNEVRTRCLDTIAEFSQDLEQASKPAVVSPPNIPSSIQFASQGTTASNGAAATPTMVRLRRLGGPQSPIPDGRGIGQVTSTSSGIQELIPARLGSATLQQYDNISPKTHLVRVDEEKTVLSTLGKYLIGPEKIAAALTTASSIFSMPGGGSLGDSGIRLVYAKSQVVIWAVEGLAHLVAASIAEDRYGVVQKDLPKVLEALLLLQQTVERHRKGTTATARKNRFETRDLQLKQELRVALKSSLFRICVAFGEHLDALPLAPELRKKINNYQSFAEA